VRIECGLPLALHVDAAADLDHRFDIAALRPTASEDRARQARLGLRADAGQLARAVGTSRSTTQSGPPLTFLISASCARRRPKDDVEDHRAEFELPGGRCVTHEAT
jgi:hypothetical protein